MLEVVNPGAIHVWRGKGNIDIWNIYQHCLKMAVKGESVQGKGVRLRGDRRGREEGGKDKWRRRERES